MDGRPPCPCQGTNGKVLSNTVDTVSVGPGGSILTAAATLSTVFTDKTATTAAVQDTARVSGISLLGGLITADAIKAVASVNATSTTVTPSPAGSTFVNLKIAGSPINATVAPNSVVDIPGLGQVTLNKTHTSGDSQTNETLLVQMLVITVQTTNTFGLPVGATIVVAQAEAGFNRAQPAAVLSGLAYATYGNAAVGNTLSNTLSNTLGHTAGVSIGCVISGSHTNTNTIADVKATGILTTGAGNTSAFGQATANTALVKTTATITSVQLLGTLVTADAITAVAQDSLSGGVFTPSTAGSQFAGLKVAGVSIPINVPLTRSCRCSGSATSSSMSRSSRPTSVSFRPTGRI